MNFEFIIETLTRINLLKFFNILTYIRYILLNKMFYNGDKFYRIITQILFMAQNKSSFHILTNGKLQEPVYEI